MVASDAGNLAQSAKHHDTAVRLAGGDYCVRQFSDLVLHIARRDTVGATRIRATLDRDPRLAQRAFMACHVGLKNSACPLLDQAVKSRVGDVLWVLTGVPYFDAIRQEPRYRAICSGSAWPRPRRGSRALTQ